MQVLSRPDSFYINFFKENPKVKIDPDDLDFSFIDEIS